MKTMTVGELKAQFSEVLGMIAENGEPIAISYGKKRERVAAIVPFKLLKSQGSRPLGLSKVMQILFFRMILSCVMRICFAHELFAGYPCFFVVGIFTR